MGSMPSTSASSQNSSPEAPILVQVQALSALFGARFRRTPAPDIGSLPNRSKAARVPEQISFRRPVWHKFCQHRAKVGGHRPESGQLNSVANRPNSAQHCSIPSQLWTERANFGIVCTDISANFGRISADFGPSSAQVWSTLWPGLDERWPDVGPNWDAVQPISAEVGPKPVLARSDFQRWASIGDGSRHVLETAPKLGCRGGWEVFRGGRISILAPRCAAATFPGQHLLARLGNST